MVGGDGELNCDVYRCCFHSFCASVCTTADDSATTAVGSLSASERQQLSETREDSTSSATQHQRSYRETIHVHAAVPSTAPSARVRLVSVVADACPGGHARRAALLHPPQAGSIVMDKEAIEVVTYGSIHEINAARKGIEDEVSTWPEAMVVPRNNMFDRVVPIGIAPIRRGYFLRSNKGVCEDSDFTPSDLAAVLALPSRSISLTSALERAKLAKAKVSALYYIMCTCMDIILKFLHMLHRSRQALAAHCPHRLHLCNQAA